MLLIVLAAGIFAAFIFVPFLNKACCSGEYKAFVSPDGHWAVKVYRINNIPLMMPGSSGDAPGYVQLVDRQGKVFAEEDVEMVQLVEQVEWSEAQVNIKFVADWMLPTATTVKQ
ncbi:MAG TPA: hypothetical protein VN030_07755 [Cellvibrio sp.]|nr:hypothetical protein [Cellvibrio sp.]